MVKVKEIRVEYFYTKQPKVYESERLVIGFTGDTDDVDVAKSADEMADTCMEIVHRRLGLVKEEIEEQFCTPPSSRRRHI